MDVFLARDVADDAVRLMGARHLFDCTRRAGDESDAGAAAAQFAQQR